MRGLWFVAVAMLAVAPAFAQGIELKPPPAQAPAPANATSSTITPTQTEKTSDKPDTTKPINVNSDTLSADIKANIGIYVGHVVVTQDTLKMRSDQLKVYATKGKPTKLEASGNVVFDSPTGSATGEFGTYDVGAHLITLTGKDVVLVRDKNVMHGTKLEVHTDTSEAHLYSQGVNNNRVQGLFIPPPKNTASTAPKANQAAAPANPG